ncbi:hypothetical protein ACH5RR_012657 [Cinchona calisaya]|uniref:Uncharacterized protein n=1 Tax=Cinchona calisaya TaxID=153742 RepID=A0ABD3A892_9GENT
MGDNFSIESDVLDQIKVSSVDLNGVKELMLVREVFLDLSWPCKIRKLGSHGKNGKIGSSCETPLFGSRNIQSSSNIHTRSVNRSHIGDDSDEVRSRNDVFANSNAKAGSSCSGNASRCSGHLIDECCCGVLSSRRGSSYIVSSEECDPILSGKGSRLATTSNCVGCGSSCLASPSRTSSNSKGINGSSNSVGNNTSSCSYDLASTEVRHGGCSPSLFPFFFLLFLSFLSFSLFSLTLSLTLVVSKAFLV